MRTTGMRPITLCVVLGLFDSCTTSDLALSTAPSVAPAANQTASRPIRASDRMFYWREEARELHEMANHREREADLVSKKKPGAATNEFVKQMRSLAHRLNAAAEYADAQARQAEQEVPHGTGDFAPQLF